MLRLEVLDQQDKVLTSQKLKEGLTLVGQSPSADVHLTGEGIGALHIGIKHAKEVVLMDLGGPTRLRVNGKETIEHVLAEETTTVEIGSRRLRIQKLPEPIVPLQNQAWEPLIAKRSSDKDAGRQIVRVRLYCKGTPEDLVNTASAFTLGTQFGLEKPWRLVWFESGKARVQVPAEWVALGGRIQKGKAGILKLADWNTPAELEANTVYRIFAGPYLAELLVAPQGIAIGREKLELLPKELRKPLGITAAAVLLLMGVWSLVMMETEAEKVEEPYPVFARIQNVPVDVIADPEPVAGPQGGGGSGSQSAENAAPQPSKLAASLTGGLRSLMSGVLSNSKVSDAVVSETGLAGAAVPTGGVATNPVPGQLAAVKGGADAGVANAAKLGKLALAGSGQGFSGGSGTGLGSGHGKGIGSGVGDGIGTGTYKMVEEESFVDGGLDKSLIAAVIQNNLAQIKYCYERQLVADPDLFGKVVAKWTINGKGLVEAAGIKQSTLNSAAVEKCIVSKISGWKFAQPKNGGTVSVTYPFLFKSTR